MRSSRYDAHVCGVLDQTFLEQVEGGERGGHGDRIAAEGGGVRAGRPVHNVRARDGGGERHTAGDAFSYRYDVGHDAKVLGGK